MSYRIKNKGNKKLKNVPQITADPINHIENGIIFVIITFILMLIFLRYVELGYYYSRTLLKMPDRMLTYGIIFGVITAIIYIIGVVTKRLKTAIPFAALGLFLSIYSIVMWKVEFNIPKFKLQYAALVIYFIAAMAYLIFQYCLLSKRKKSKSN